MYAKAKRMFMHTVLGISALGMLAGMTGINAFAATTPKFPQGQHGFRGRHFGTAPVALPELAAILHISQAALQADLKAKETLVQIAQKHGISKAKLIADLESNYKATIHKEAAKMKWSAAQEQKMIAQYDANIGKMITGTDFMGRGHAPGWFKKH